MPITITDEEKKKIAPYVLIIMMIFVIAGFSYLWNLERNKRIKLENDKGVIATIEGIEQPGQAEVKNREAINQSIDEQIAEGNTRLNALYNVEKQIRTRRDKNVSTKSDITSISRKLASMGFTNTIVLGNYTAAKTFRGYSTQAGRGSKVK